MRQTSLHTSAKTKSDTNLGFNGDLSAALTVAGQPPTNQTLNGRMMANTGKATATAAFLQLLSNGIP